MGKQYYIMIDTETTKSGKVADFAAIIVDRKGKVYNQCAVLVQGIFGHEPLFYADNGHFAKKSLERRTNAYTDMLNRGTRMLASPNAINRWLEQAKGKYNPTYTAYNISFDNKAMDNTGIDHSIFTDRFCLYHACFTRFAQTKAYKKFILENHLFNNRTSKGNMTLSCTAETMTKFIMNDPNLPDEPHTALLDLLDYERPLLVALTKRYSRKQLMDVESYSWEKLIVKDHYKVK